MNGQAFLIMIAAIGAVLTLALAAVWVFGFHGRKLPILVGGLTFFLFVNVLEGLCHYGVLLIDHPVSRFLNSHVWAYGLYGALAAGVFEETGRLLAFQTLLRHRRERKSAISYGIGHGGMEVLLVMCAGQLVMALTGGPELLAAITPGMCAIALLERCAAVIFHISASVLVFDAVRTQGKSWLYPAAILLHAAMDFPAVLYQQGILNLASTEIYVWVYALAVAAAAVRVYRSLPETEE